MDKFTQFENSVFSFFPIPDQQVEKNKTATFVLSAPRSGTTLLAAMLAGHTKLFAPPELVLLPFNDMQARRNFFRHSDIGVCFLNSAIYAVMQADGCTVESARHTIQRFEENASSIQEFVSYLQHAIGSQILVMKANLECLNIKTLSYIERHFDSPRYLHLTRHPDDMVYSFAERRLNRFHLWSDLPLSACEIAESVWQINHKNILEHLGQIPDHRQCRFNFENLVQNLAAVQKVLCQFLNIDFEETLLNPYQDNQRRMIDGDLFPGELAVDHHFTGYDHVRAEMANRWKKRQISYDLSDKTWEIAKIFGYERG